MIIWKIWYEPPLQSSKLYLRFKSILTAVPYVSLTIDRPERADLRRERYPTGTECIHEPKDFVTSDRKQSHMVSCCVSRAALLNSPGEEECAKNFEIKGAYLKDVEQDSECELEEQETELPKDTLPSFKEQFEILSLVRRIICSRKKLRKHLIACSKSCTGLSILWERALSSRQTTMDDIFKWCTRVKRTSSIKISL